MEKIWILAADSVCGRFFQAEKRTGPIIEIEDTLNPQARMPDRELVTDDRGRTAVSGNPDRRHAYGEDYREEDHQRDEFARKLIERLEKMRVRGELDGVYLIAEPGFLGLLRKHIGKHLQACVKGEVKQRVTKDSAEEIRNLLPRDMIGLGG